MKKYLIILVCVWLCGCVSTKKVRNQSLEVAKFDIEKFNGNYASEKDITSPLISNEPLFDKLFPVLLFKGYQVYPFPIPQNTIINLYFDGKKTLTITAIENNKVISEKKISGKIKDNYFSANRKLFLIPIPILCYFHEETKILLGNNKMGRLVLKIGNFGAGWVLMAASSEYISQSQFKKLN